VYEICELADPTNCDQATVTVTVRESATPPASAPSTPPAQANLSITKSGPASAKSGQVVTFTLVVRNNGPNTATDVVVTDTLPNDLDFVAGSITIDGALDASCDASSSTIKCTIASLETGDRVEITIGARVAAGAVSAVNQASVVSTTSDPDGSDNAASWSVGVASATPSAKPAKPTGPTRLSVRKIARIKGTVKPGQVYRYSIVVKNIGTRTAVGVTVCDVPPKQLVFVSAPGATFSKGRACWHIKQLRPGASRTFVVTVRLDTNATPGSVRNGAVASAKNSKKPVRTVSTIGVEAAAAEAGRPGGVTG
jgi:uncharacterized repeat protein (TIGR01451 family)